MFSLEKNQRNQRLGNFPVVPVFTADYTFEKEADNEIFIEIDLSALTGS